MIELPYGIADFRRIRQQGMVYIDRTGYFRVIESLGSALVFLRPRRFGKSLWLQTLANYYDLRRAGEFSGLFGDLAVGREPTPLANRFFVLQWNFSVVDPGGSVEQIAESLREHVSSQVKVFASDYKGELPADIEVEGSAAAILASLLSVVRKTPHKLYLLIDEYDAPFNKAMSGGIEPQHLAYINVPFRRLLTAVKCAMEGQGLERVFITGVSPVALSDLRNGFDIAKNVSLEPELSGLCGFQESEIRNLTEKVLRARGLTSDVFEDVIETMKTWYKGFLFTEAPGENIYNPIDIFYFLGHLHRHGVPPLHGKFHMDFSQVAFLANTPAGAEIIKVINKDGKIAIPQLETFFFLENLLTQLREDRGAVASLLYFMGLLTLTGIPGQLRFPNLFAKQLSLTAS